MICAFVLIVLLVAFIYDAEPMLNRWFVKKVIVNCEHNPYLHRWYVFKTARVTLFVHKFVRSDEDRALHDHPWAFLVIPLWRGYIEHSDRLMKYEWPGCDRRFPVINRVLPFIGTRYRNFHYRHRVELLKDSAGSDLPAWSIFFHFERVKDWGYWTKAGFILHSKWWSDLCE